MTTVVQPVVGNLLYANLVLVIFDPQEDQGSQFVSVEDTSMCTYVSALPYRSHSAYLKGHHVSIKIELLPSSDLSLRPGWFLVFSRSYKSNKHKPKFCHKPVASSTALAPADDIPGCVYCHHLSQSRLQERRFKLLVYLRRLVSEQLFGSVMY